MKCVKCGSDNKKMIGPFCIDCYPLNIKTKPIELKMCVKCGGIFIHGKWVKNKQEQMEEMSKLMRRKIKGDKIENVRYLGDTNEIEITLKDYGVEFKVLRTSGIEIEKMVCQTCSRMSSGYFEAIVQLRGNEKKVERALRRIIKCMEKVSFIAKIDEDKRGFNIFTGSSKATAQCLINLNEEMKFKQKITRTLSGLKEGKKMYRVTYSIRFE